MGRASPDHPPTLSDHRVASRNADRTGSAAIRSAGRLASAARTRGMSPAAHASPSATRSSAGGSRAASSSAEPLERPRSDECPLERQTQVARLRSRQHGPLGACQAGPSSRAMSAMSCGEPRSLLRPMSPARETTVMECPSHSVLMRVCHAFPVAPGWTSITSSESTSGSPADDLGESVHHDLTLGQPNGCALSSNERVGQERFDDLLDRVRRCQEVDIDRRSRVRVDGHRDAPTDGIRNARGAQDAHDGSKLLEKIRHTALGERNTTQCPTSFSARE